MSKQSISVLDWNSDHKIARTPPSAVRIIRETHPKDPKVTVDLHSSTNNEKQFVFGGASPQFAYGGASPHFAFGGASPMFTD